ncbi:uncharacterized protein MONBRDRAFT_26881 [Monosiga brevicollis MX1]|uniref:TauD/TfdA-like domain-containing protein n=1 Tax=Monosiga brevicollis TaxID=81824 RepID=A9V3T4_MONBE|nr:uncharacterized protein MONBRDRAFT_26881 [Monosiga brevicollis MX1]EDQ87864.1 predicted protein [Monosiga brevicollis MX1]|eukprot:XP_001747397.1 hypothetical protein [Monosiga brevicollis MX1]
MAAKVAKTSEGQTASGVTIGQLGTVVQLAPPDQRVFDKRAVPAIVRCSASDNSDRSVTAATACSWLADHQDAIEALLKEHGAVLFRDFPLKTAEDFDAFVKSFKGYEDLPYEESLSFAVRVDVTGRVCTTNEGKKGGQVLRRLEAKHPQFVADLEAKGVKYTAFMAAVADPTKGAGRSWKSFFGCESKDAVEKRMQELGYSWEWQENEVLKTTSPKLSAVRIAPGTDRKVFFNQLVAQIANATEFSANSGSSSDADVLKMLSKYMTFGDDTPMDVEALLFAKRCCDDTAVELNWQAQDVALLDNYLVMHARRDFDGPRRVLASLVR